MLGSEVNQVEAVLKRTEETVGDPSAKAASAAEQDPQRRDQSF
jgi:hypothetical protein